LKIVLLRTVRADQTPGFRPTDLERYVVHRGETALFPTNPLTVSTPDTPELNRRPAYWLLKWYLPAMAARPALHLALQPHHIRLVIDILETTGTEKRSFCPAISVPSP
jgi:hypothetical protein